MPKKLNPVPAKPVHRNMALDNKERRAKKVEREALKEDGRKTTPRGTARAKRRRSLQRLWSQNHHAEVAGTKSQESS